MNDDLRNALEQLKRCAGDQWPRPYSLSYHLLTPRGAQALLDERDALRDVCEAIIREGDPYTATRNWPDPALFAEWAIGQARTALAKTRNGEA